ncbi:MAG: penicillin-binding protein activator LpoB [Spirochaetes bacterium]|uniref:Penicillin-binding protein activator LpoB n=1 Tax=Candidatus Gallitreponema excrementavium TaxID=2840840 RepID=A0A9D9HQI3_9SPIR|nr:penicillin-binding protein activator LpoB [Candidatus Gallitreponema excrementavium]
MSKIKVVVFFVLVLIVAGCSSSPSVKRVAEEEQIDLSGYWNDTDVRIVCDNLVSDCLNSPVVSKRLTEYEVKNGSLPVVVVGQFKNTSDEHIDVSVISKRMEAALLNSGKVDFVASSSERDDLRQERIEQQSWASEETAKALANEIGADFMLIGSVKTVVDQIDRKAVRNYFVYAEMIEIETGKKIWIGENSEIKKYIKYPAAKF